MKNPSAFKGPAKNQQWRQQQQQLQPQQQALQQQQQALNPGFNQASPANYGQGSPGYTRHTPQGSPAQPASARLAVPEDKTRPPLSSPNARFHEPNSIPQRASVIADPQSRVPDQNRLYNDLCEKLNPGQVPDWEDKHSRLAKRLKNDNERSFTPDDVAANQRLGVFPPETVDQNRPEVHPSHRVSDTSQGQILQSAANNPSDQISSMRHFRPQKTHVQPQSSNESYANSIDQQRILPTLQTGGCSTVSGVAWRLSILRQIQKISFLKQTSIRS